MFFFIFFKFRDRVCGKDTLIQKCFLLIASMLFYVWRPCLISMDLPASCRICDGNTLTSSVLFSPGTCSASRAVITRWDLAQRDQMTQVFLVQAALAVSRLTWLPTGCLTLAMCSADVSLRLCEHHVPDRNVSNISSNILYSWDTSSKLSELMTPLEI